MSCDGINSQVAGLRVIAIKAALAEQQKLQAQHQAGIDAMTYRLQAVRIALHLHSELISVLPSELPVMIIWRAVACLLARVAIASDSDSDKICDAFLPLLRLELNLARGE